MAVSQVQYRLLHRKPETDGVLDACRQMEVALVAYRPIGAGAIRCATIRRYGRSQSVHRMRLGNPNLSHFLLARVSGSDGRRASVGLSAVGGAGVPVQLAARRRAVAWTGSAAGEASRSGMGRRCANLAVRPPPAEPPREKIGWTHP
jgi:hypothetical protein